MIYTETKKVFFFHGFFLDLRELDYYTIYYKEPYLFIEAVL